MAYRNPPQYRSWNAAALGIKQEVPENDSSYKDRQRRRDSWSPQRSRAMRGRGTWSLDNRPQTRRRNTMPNSNQEFNHHADNYESGDYKQLEDNPILEEYSSGFPVNDHCDLKIKENNDNDYKDESSYFNNRKKHSGNIYHPPMSKSTSYKDWKSNSSSDDGSQSRGSYYSRYESENYKAQWNDRNDRNDSWERGSINHEPDQMWLHDKFESLENGIPEHITENVTENVIENVTENITENVVTENVTENVIDNTDNVIDETVTETVTKNLTSKDKKDASTQVSPSDISNEIFNNGIAIFSKKMNEPKSTVDSGRTIFPDEITIKVAELTLKDSDVDKPESVATQTSSSETESEIASETSPVTPKDEELPMLINLDEDDNTDKQIIQPKISEDILTLDWSGYQKTLFEKEYMEYKQLNEMSTPRKLDTKLKDFDLLL